MRLRSSGGSLISGDWLCVAIVFTVGDVLMIMRKTTSRAATYVMELRAERVLAGTMTKERLLSRRNWKERPGHPTLDVSEIRWQELTLDP